MKAENEQRNQYNRNEPKSNTTDDTLPSILTDDSYEQIPTVSFEDFITFRFMRVL